jgi:urea carboxylase-associated protein 2
MNPQSTTPTDERSLHRARYEALRAKGQGDIALALPELTHRTHRLNEDAVLHRELVPGGWYWTTLVCRGEALRLINTDGRSAVSMIAWSEADTSERLNTADTMKVQWSTGLRKGRLLYTEMGRVAFSIIEDTSGEHDPIVGATTKASMKAIPGCESARNSRDNFLYAAAKIGLARRDVPACVNFFAPVGIEGDGRFIWRAGRRTAGDFVDLRAEMDLWVVLSNAGHPLDPEPQAVPAPVEIVRFRAPVPTPDDACRHSCAEAERAFAQTERHVGRGDKS